MANKPQTLKKPVPKYVVDRMNGFGEQIAALQEAGQQFLRDTIGIWGIDGSRFRVWWDFQATDAKGQPAPTYEVLMIADFERRLRLQEAMQQAQGAPKADPTPKAGEKRLAVGEKAG